jgi:hypothetical protein
LKLAPLFSLFAHVKSLFLFLSLTFQATPVFAQIQPAWVARYNNNLPSGQHQALKMLLDPAENIYICGFSRNTNGGTGYATLKYAPNRTQLWVARFDPTNYPSARPTFFALDSRTNLVVTGTATTIKYDHNGVLVWEAPYNAAAVATDTSNNVYITGIESNYVTIKLDLLGSNRWSRTYTTPYGTSSQTINVDAGNNIYVCGGEFYAAPHSVSRTATVAAKYDQNGNQLWLREGPVDNGGSGPIQIVGSAFDSDDNFYFEFNMSLEAGPPSPYSTSAYSTTGASLWAAYDPTGGNYSLAYALALDHHTNVIITGVNAYYYPQSSYGTYKISSTGAYLWTNIYPAVPVNVNGATSVAIDAADNVYVTGYSAEANGTNDIVTIAYDTNGKQLWLQRYTGLGYGAVGNAIAVDNNGNVYVAGYENVPGGGTQMVLIKYAPVTGQHQSNGNFLLQAQGSPGQPFAIQATTNLQSWLDLGTQSADTNGLLQYLDTNAAHTPSRFYLAIPQ